jgi:alpha-1,3-mannosyltransferase
VKALQITRTYYPAVGGVERFVQDLSRHLLARGVQSDVLTLNRCSYRSEILPPAERINGIRVQRIPFRGGRRFFLAPGVLSFVNDYDVLHIHNIDFFFNFLTLLRWYHRKPTVVSTHGGFFHTRKLLLLKRAYFALVARALLPRTEAVIADSTQDFALFRPITEKTVLIENGVDFARFAGLRKEAEKGLLLYVGRLASNKRVDNLIRVFRHVKARFNEARLVLVGCDFEGIASDLRNLAVGQGVGDAVIFAGEVSDVVMDKYLERAQLFVSASEYEGFGISTVEAMSASTVPVVNSIPPFQNLIEDGVTGFLTCFSDSEEASDVIVSALQMNSDSLRQMGDRAREAARKYAWENVISRYMDIYDQVLK